MDGGWSDFASQNISFLERKCHVRHDVELFFWFVLLACLFCFTMDASSGESL